MPDMKDIKEYWADNKIDKVIAADSGLNKAIESAKYFQDNGFLPSLIVGDGDSMSGNEKIPNGCVVEKCNRAKDLSDSEIALLRASEEKKRLNANGENVLITLAGGDGGRLDHLLAIYDTFSMPYHADVWLLKEQKAVYVGEGCTARIKGLEKGEIVSVLRLMGDRKGGSFETKGLKWSADVFRKEGIPSLSNWVSSSKECAEVKVCEKAALVITSHKARIEIIREEEKQEREEEKDAGGEKEALEKRLSFTAEIDKMTGVFRRTLLIDKSRRENDAEHSWHIAVMATVFSRYLEGKYKENVNEEHAAVLCLFHDLVEIYAGDTFAYDREGYKTKEIREREGAKRLFSILPFTDSVKGKELWEEFEKMESNDSVLANCMDRLQPFLHNTLTEGFTWVENKVYEKDVIERMSIIKDAMPVVWKWVEEKIQEEIRKGHIIKDARA